MELILEFLEEHAIHENYILVLDINKLLDSQGFLEHEESLHDVLYDFGVLENGIIVDKILNIYRKTLVNLLLKMFIVVDENINIYQLKNILEDLISLEKSLESSVLIELYREENTPLQQMLDWISFINEDNVTLYEDYVLSISENLIDNIVELHELRNPLNAEELDEKIKTRITHIRKIREAKPDVYGVEYIKKNGFKTFVDSETLSALYGVKLRANPITQFNSRDVALHVLSLCLLTSCQNDFSIACKSFIEFNFPNPLAQSDLQSQIAKLIAEFDISC